jgi:hypothetical protein
MKKSFAMFASVIALTLVTLAPSKASAQGVTVYVGPGYPGYGYDPGYYGYDEGYYPSYGYDDYPGYAYPSYGVYPRYYGYGRPYYRPYAGQGRRVARRVNRRWNRWD